VPAACGHVDFHHFSPLIANVPPHQAPGATQARPQLDVRAAAAPACTPLVPSSLPSPARSYHARMHVGHPQPAGHQQVRHCRGARPFGTGLPVRLHLLPVRQARRVRRGHAALWRKVGRGPSHGRAAVMPNPCFPGPAWIQELLLVTVIHVVVCDGCYRWPCMCTGLMLWCAAMVRHEALMHPLRQKGVLRKAGAVDEGCALRRKAGCRGCAGSLLYNQCMPPLQSAHHHHTCVHVCSRTRLHRHLHAPVPKLPH